MEYTTKDVRKLLRMVRTRLLNGKIDAKHFDMDNVLYEDCGTVGCIGGWCLFLSDNKYGNLTTEIVQREGAYDEAAFNLFFDYPKSRSVTPALAAKAITKYLGGKTDPWRGLRR